MYRSWSAPSYAPSSSRWRDLDLRRRLALPSGGIFPGQCLRWGLLLLLDRNQISGGKRGVPVGSARVSGGARDTTLTRPRLLNRLPDDRRRGGERESSPAPKRQKFSCSNVCVLGVHSIKMHTFSQKELSPPHSINVAPLALPQSSAGPPPTQVIAAHPTTKLLKPLCQFMSAWKVIPGISRWLLSVIERGYTLQFRRRPPRFNGVVQSLTLPRNAQGSETRERSSRASPTKRAGERFLQPLFRGTQEGWGAPSNSRSQTHKQCALQTSVQDDNAETDPGTNSLRGLVCVRGFEGHVLSHSDSTASQTVSEFCFRGHSVPILCSSVRAGFGPAHIFKVRGCSTFPPQGERDTHPQLSGRLADFSSVPGHATQPHRLAAYSLVVPRAMCKQRKSILAPSQSITYLGVCMDSLEMRARLSRERAAAILSYLRHFREGSSVHFKKFQRLLGLMASASAVCHLGLLHMRPLQLWLKSRVPWTAWTSGRLSIAVTCGCI